MEAADESGGIAVGAFGGLVEFWAEEAVGEDLPGGDSESGSRSFLEKRGGCRGEVGAEDEGGGGAVGGEGLEKKAGGGAGAGRIGHACFLGKGIVLEPIEEGPAEGTDDAELGEVDVGIDETGEEKAATEVECGGAGVGLKDGGEIATGGDAAVADEESAVGVGFQRGGAGGGVEDVGAEDFALRCHRFWGKPRSTVLVPGSGQRLVTTFALV